MAEYQPISEVTRPNARDDVGHTSMYPPLSVVTSRGGKEQTRGRQGLQRHKTRLLTIKNTPRGQREIATKALLDILQRLQGSNDAKALLKAFVEEHKEEATAVLLEFVDSRSGQTILHLTASAGSNLLQRVKGIDPLEEDEHGLSQCARAAANPALRWALAFAASHTGNRSYSSFTREQQGPALVNIQDSAGWTPLLCCCAQGDLAAAWLLIDHGADPRLPNLQGSTPLHYLVRQLFSTKECRLHGHAEQPSGQDAGQPASSRVQLLSRFRSRKEVLRDDPKLQEAMHLALMRRFLAAGASVDATNEFGETPLMQAAARGSPAAVRFLLENGADCTLENARGESAHFYGENSRCEGIPRILRQHVHHRDGEKRPLRALDDITMLDKDLQRVAELLRGNLLLTDRKGRLAVYRDTFTGEACVDYLLAHLPIRERSEAASYAARLMKAGLIKGHGAKSSTFKDSERWFQFGKATSAAEATIGETGATLVELREFQIQNIIGRGAFGMVYLVSHEQTKKQYALKKIQKASVGKEGSREFRNLMAEKEILQNDSIFLCNVHFAFQTTTDFYLAMDFLGGGDLAYLLRRKGRLDEPTIQFLAAEIALGIDYMHECGVIYRDLKLANILLTTEGHAVLADFGLSKIVEHGSVAALHTACGTPVFSAPEVLAGEAYTDNVDWWSFGILLYCLAMGKAPFSFDGDFERLLNEIDRGVDFSPSLVGPHLPSLDALPFSVSGQEFVTLLLDPEPDLRLDDIEAMKREPFFDGCDWGKLALKKVASPLAGFLSSWQKNFDEKYLSMKTPVRLTDKSSEDIPDFAYVA